MRLLKRLSALVFGLAMLLLVPSIARADDVTDWNQHMLRAGTVGGTTALVMSRVAAIVQASVFDAVNGIDRKYTPVHVPPALPVLRAVPRPWKRHIRRWWHCIQPKRARSTRGSPFRQQPSQATGMKPVGGSRAESPGARLPRTASCPGAPPTASRQLRLHSLVGRRLENGAPHRLAFCPALVLSSPT